MYYQNETKFNCVYSRNSLPKIKDRAYVTNLDEYVNAENVTHFDSFRFEHIPKEIHLK